MSVIRFTVFAIYPWCNKIKYLSFSEGHTYPEKLPKYYSLFRSLPKSMEVCTPYLGMFL